MQTMEYKVITKSKDFNEQYLDISLRICWQVLLNINRLSMASDIVKRHLDIAFGESWTVIFELKNAAS